MASKPDIKASSTESTTTTTTTSSLRPSSRRSYFFSSAPSLSSTSSLSSSIYFPDDSPLSPTTPLRFTGIPFSWEKLPGIPKKQNSKKQPSSMISLLPLPPSSRKSNPKEASPMPLKKYSTITDQSFREDPFLAALVECSKDDEDAIAIYWKGSKANRLSSISDRLGFISIYTSCKRTCAVSESTVYLPRSTPLYLLNRR